MRDVSSRQVARLWDFPQTTERRLDVFHSFARPDFQDVVVKLDRVIRMKDREPAWFCIRTMRKQELIAYGNLRQLEGIEAFYPRLRSTSAARGSTAIVLEPLFPGHIFAYFALKPALRIVRQTRGIKSVLSLLKAWPTITEEDMLELKRGFGPSEVMDRPARRLEPGLTFDVTAGPLRGFRSVLYYDIPAAQRVGILLQLLRKGPLVEMSPNS